MITNITGTTTGAVLQLSVSAAAGSEGAALAYVAATSRVTMTNTSAQTPFEYRIGNSGAWKFVGVNTGAIEDFDLSSQKLFFRQTANIAGVPTVEISLESIPVVAGNLAVQVGGVPLAVSKLNRSGNSLMVVTDSYGGNGYTNSASAIDTNWWGFIPLAQALSGQRLTVVSMQARGGSGVTYDGVGLQLRKQLALALPSGGTDLLLMGGVNDIGFTSATFDDITNEYLYLLDMAIAAGVSRIWWCTQPVPNSANATYTAAKRALMMKLNAWIRKVGSAMSSTRWRDNVYVVDLAGAAVNPTNANGDYRTNGAQSDNLHPSNVGAYYMAKELARVWNAYIPPAPILVSSAADNYGFNSQSVNILDNGLMLNPTGGIAAGYETRVTGGTAGTPTVEARADGFGNNQVLPVNFTAAAQVVRIATTGSSDGSGQATIMRSRVANGDTLIAKAEVSFDSPVNLAAVTLDLFFNGSLTFKLASGLIYNSLYCFALPEACTLTMVTPPMTYDAATIGNLNVVATRVTATGAGTGSATIKVGRWSVEKIVA